MFLTSLQDKVKRIQELRRSNAAQPVRNKKKRPHSYGVGRVVKGVI